MVLALLECLIFQSEPNNPIQDLDTWRMLDEYLGIPSKRETFLSKVLYIFRRLLQTAIKHILLDTCTISFLTFLLTPSMYIVPWHMQREL